MVSMWFTMQFVDIEAPRVLGEIQLVSVTVLDVAAALFEVKSVGTILPGYLHALTETDLTGVVDCRTLTGQATYGRVRQSELRPAVCSHNRNRDRTVAGQPSISRQQRNTVKASLPPNILFHWLNSREILYPKHVCGLCLV